MRKCQQTADREIVSASLALHLEQDVCHLEGKQTQFDIRRTNQLAQLR